MVVPVGTWILNRRCVLNIFSKDVSSVIGLRGLVVVSAP